jgi:glutathione S-transferase
VRAVARRTHRASSRCIVASRLTPHAQITDFLKKRARDKMAKLALMLKDKPFLGGDAFTVADSYAFICLSWVGYLGLPPLEGKLKEYYDRIAALPNVKAAQARMEESPEKVFVI